MSSTARTEVIQALHPLLRYFANVPFQIGMNSILGGRVGYRARVTHLIEKNELWISTVNSVGLSQDVSKFDLNDPRSIAAVVRSFCRRVNCEMPSFESIDRVLNEGAPEWMLDD